MKIEIVISIEPELVQALERILGDKDFGSHSALIEEALRRFLAGEQREMYDPHDLELINRNAGRLNQEAADVLAYQIEL